MSQHRRLFAGTLAVAMLVSALPGTAVGQSAPSSPEGVEWVLTSMDTATLPADVSVTLSLADAVAVGNSGCNSYFGAYELDGPALTFPEPFGSTMMMCDEAAMSVEFTYLPLLSATTSWSIDAESTLSLADADGIARLTYSEMPIDITATDVATLAVALADLQAQIDVASSEVTALTERADSINVSRFDRRVTALEENVDGISSPNLRRRINALEETTARLERTIDRFRERIIALEATSASQAQRLTTQSERLAAHQQRLDSQGQRIAALEEASPEPTPDPEG